MWEANKMAGLPVLRSVGLNIGYPSKKGDRVIAGSLDLELKKGELLCLVGPNGVGKSTLVRTLAGVQPGLKGDVLVGGKKIGDLSALERARKIGLVLTDRVELEGFSVFDMVALGRFPHTDWKGILDKKDRQAVYEALELVGGLDLQQRKISQLSDGERQKVMIARALAQEAEMILLDEPTSFLDLLRKVEVLHILRTLAGEQGKAILLALHDIPLALQFADLIWLFRKEGTIIEGAPEDLVLSGSLVDTFSSREHVFDPLSGTYPVKNGERIPLYLKGSGDALLWTGKALERQGIFRAVSWETGSQGWLVEVIEEKGKPAWIFSAEGTSETFSSIYHLLDRLRNIASNSPV